MGHASTDQTRKIVAHVADSILAQQDRLAQTVTFQQGKPLKEAIGEVGATGNVRAGKKIHRNHVEQVWFLTTYKNLAINRECPIFRSQPVFWIERQPKK